MSNLSLPSCRFILDGDQNAPYSICMSNAQQLAYLPLNDAPQCVKVVTTTFTTSGGRVRRARYRFDGRGLPSNTFRVDYLGTMGHIWEAIDGGDPVTGLRACKALCAKHLEKLSN